MAKQNGKDRAGESEQDLTLRVPADQIHASTDTGPIQVDQTHLNLRLLRDALVVAGWENNGRVDRYESPKTWGATKRLAVESGYSYGQVWIKVFVGVPGLMGRWDWSFNYETTISGWDRSDPYGMLRGVLKTLGVAEPNMVEDAESAESAEFAEAAKASAGKGKKRGGR